MIVYGRAVFIRMSFFIAIIRMLTSYRIGFWSFKIWVIYVLDKVDIER